ncbi:hypothetical protein BT93_K0835 [Corymbia citriodora subsp. variegata]|nr:hypothetical protein BT93_K0835 [Corymbia citriodora subsp. variegata]
MCLSISREYKSCFKCANKTTGEFPTRQTRGRVRCCSSLVSQIGLVATATHYVLRHLLPFSPLRGEHLLRCRAFRSFAIRCPRRPRNTFCVWKWRAGTPPLPAELGTCSASRCRGGRRGGAFRRLLAVKFRLALTRFVESISGGYRGSMTRDRIRYGERERELSFDETPIFRLKMRRPGGSAGSRFRLPRIPCISPDVDFEYGFFDGEKDASGRGRAWLPTEEAGTVRGRRDRPKEEEEEEFIANFYEQMKLQRQISYLRYSAEPRAESTDPNLSLPLSLSVSTLMIFAKRVTLLYIPELFDTSEYRVLIIHGFPFLHSSQCI